MYAHARIPEMSFTAQDVKRKHLLITPEKLLSLALSQVDTSCVGQLIHSIEQTIGGRVSYTVLYLPILDIYVYLSAQLNLHLYLPIYLPIFHSMTKVKI